MQCIQTIYIHILPTFYHKVCIIKKGDNSLLIYGICYAAGNIFPHFTQLTQSQIDLITFFLQEFAKI